MLVAKLEDHAKKWRRFLDDTFAFYMSSGVPGRVRGVRPHPPPNVKYPFCEY